MTLRIVRTELTLLLREPLTLVVSVAFPLVLMVLLAGAFGSQPDPDMGGVSGVDFYVPVYSAATIAVLGFMSVPTHIAAYREHGVLRRFSAAGVPRTAVLRAQMLVMAVLVVAGAAVMLGVGFVAYDVSPPASVPAVAVGFAVGTAAFAALGVLLGSVISTARAAQGVGMLWFFGTFFIAGGGPPPALMPGPLTTFGRWTPMGPLVASIRDPWNGLGWNPAALAALSAIAVACWFVATRIARHRV